MITGGEHIFWTKTPVKQDLKTFSNEIFKIVVVIVIKTKCNNWTAVNVKINVAEDCHRPFGRDLFPHLFLSLNQSRHIYNVNQLIVRSIQVANNFLDLILRIKKSRKHIFKSTVLKKSHSSQNPPRSYSLQISEI